jgi:5-hydroxyisourate hydrolase
MPGSELGEGHTDDDGRIANLLGSGGPARRSLPHALCHRSYFRAMGSEGFYPWVDVVFDLAAGGEHYHIPLLLSPYGYSTYRGS